MMRLSKPRIEPVPMEQYLASRAGGEGRPLESSAINIGRTWMNHPDLVVARRSLGQHLQGPNATLPRRERELGIMRMGWWRRSDYEFAQHRTFNTVDAIFTEEEIRRICLGPDSPGWTPVESTILRTVDEMHNDAFISDSTWAALSAHYSNQQILDFIMLMGQYWTVSTMLNSAGVQIEEGKKSFPDSP